MSVAGYLGKKLPEVRMPKSDPAMPDDAGIRWEGKVVNGEVGVEEAIKAEAVQASYEDALGIRWKGVVLGRLGSAVDVERSQPEAQPRGVTVYQPAPQERGRR